MGYTLYRLDGFVALTVWSNKPLITISSQTPQVQRQGYVDKFNKASKRERCRFIIHIIVLLLTDACSLISALC
jgi:hypothetical protein